MKQKVKRRLYFYAARYFRALAASRLARWKPQIVVVTGSTGKTTLLNLLEAALGGSARYSHFANSSFGIPFDILGMRRTTLKPHEWVSLYITAPFRVFAPLPKEKIYIVEADCDRPGEGKFLAEFLKPEVTLWQNVSRTHSANFDRVVDKKRFKTVEDAIAYEFGYFIEYTQNLCIVNADSPLIEKQLSRTHATVEKIDTKILEKYTIEKRSTAFTINGRTYSFDVLLPENAFSAIEMVVKTLKYLGVEKKVVFSKFTLPPGRSSVFYGIKSTTIIDSSYNASLSAMEAMLSLYQQYPSNKKWLVLGDMVEQGKEEKEEHEKLGEVISHGNFDRIILVGPRLAEYTVPVLKKHIKNKKIVQSFLLPKEALQYIEENLEGAETLLFKGARFLEGIIEHLLVHQSDISKLPRREKVWEERRRAWGL